jgi:hypothetical protein
MSNQRQQIMQNIQQMLTPLSNLTLSEGQKKPFNEQSASQIDEQQLVTGKNSITSANSGTSSSFLKRKKKLLD